MSKQDNNREQVKRLYASLCRIRRVEERVAQVYPTDKIKSPIHLSIGQEAVAVGVCEALRPEDAVFGTYRGHAAYLAKGGDLKAMVAELYGKATGCSRGKGGSMHLVDVAHGVMGTSAVVATTIPVAVGYALALQYAGRPRVTVVFLGDGATEEGGFYESLNLAALKRLPVIFVCENNLYAIHTPLRKRQANPDICGRVKGFGVDVHRFETDDVLEIHRIVSRRVEAIRAGKKGPSFFECMTYRWREHVGPGEDYALGYRDRSELAPWQEKDQVRRLAGMLEEKERAAIEAGVDKEIEDAFRFAEESPFPDKSELLDDVFAETP